jgi:hypothetical protein
LMCFNKCLEVVNFFCIREDVSRMLVLPKP